MASVFPYTNGLPTNDTFSDPLSTSPLNSPSHSSLHTDVNTAVETLEAIAQATGGRNLLYNGAMQVAQRGASRASITSGGYYTADRWRTDIGTLGTWTNSVELDAPNGSGFINSLKWLCTTADASPASNDYLFCEQRLEGQDLQSIRKGTSSAQQLTLSFWVKANVIGTYILSLWDADNVRSVSKTYTISTSATWEFKTVTFPADTTGAFVNDNSTALDIWWVLGVGSNWTSGTRNETWAAHVQANSCQGQTVNLASATNNYWQITGVQLNVGAVAAPFEFKSYGQELAECQRYYEKQRSVSQLRHTTGTNSVMNYTKPFIVQKRASPTLSFVVNGYTINSRVAAVYDDATWVAGGSVNSATATGNYYDDLSCSFDAEL